MIVTPRDLANVLPEGADVYRVLTKMAETGKTRCYGGFYWEAYGTAPVNADMLVG